MSVQHEWRCVAHNHEFEAFGGVEEVPRCPFGCSTKFVVMEFRTPVGIGSERTKLVDGWKRKLAQDYGMTDMRGDKDGSSVMSNTHHLSGGARNFDPHQQVRWAPSIFSPGQGWARSGDTPPVYSHEQAGFKGTNTPMKPLLDSAHQFKPLRAMTSFVKQKPHPT